MVDELIEKYNPDFAVEEKGSRTEEMLPEENPLGNIFKSKNIPFIIINRINKREI